VEALLKSFFVALALVALELNQFLFEVLLDPYGNFLAYYK
jgi:hypothetical protein